MRLKSKHNNCCIDVYLMNAWNCFSLYPGDLHPFTRKPFFIIVDSDNSFVFQHIPRYFGQPMVVLMSPQDIPPSFQGTLLQYTLLDQCLNSRKVLSFSITLRLSTHTKAFFVVPIQTFTSDTLLGLTPLFKIVMPLYPQKVNIATNSFIVG